ncbi:hypothetical protein [Mesobacterium pallidum]|uniref:hypothetical protein n=1 Tax=Mesobacterium pallidum TaxID=2872037 RepID=UPI001EE20DD3|nr:hypothetical protein [Mesobacterium pallidum]
MIKTLIAEDVADRIDAKPGVNRKLPLVLSILVRPLNCGRQSLSETLHFRASPKFSNYL